jgi:hypothetical protein
VIVTHAGPKTTGRMLGFVMKLERVRFVKQRDRNHKTRALNCGGIEDFGHAKAFAQKVYVRPDCTRRKKDE